MRTKRPLLSGIVSSSIIASAHFVSSIVVVMAYFIAVNALDLQIPEIYMAYVFWKENGEDLSKTQHGHLHDGRRLSKQGEVP